MPVIGPFNRRVVLERRTTTNDAFGQPIETWAPIRTVWANRRDMAGSERLRAGQELAERVSIFTFRWFADLTAGDWRLQHEGLTWDVEGIAEPRNTRRQFWELTCTAVGA